MRYVQKYVAFMFCHHHGRCCDLHNIFRCWGQGVRGGCIPLITFHSLTQFAVVFFFPPLGFLNKNSEKKIHLNVGASKRNPS